MLQPIFNYQFETLKVNLDKKNFILKVGLNRPNKANAWDLKLNQEYRQLFENAEQDSDVRCIIVYGEGKGFTSGIDISLFQQPDETDLARAALKQRYMIKAIQDAVSSVEKCNKPVIMSIHGICIGLGVDAITAADIRLCTKQTKFSVKEVDVGLAADVGTLQRLPRVVGNNSWVRDVCLTARTFDGVEAKTFGLVTDCFDTEEQLQAETLKLALLIASKSPVATYSTIHLLNQSKNCSVQNGLDYTSAYNAPMLLTEDIPANIQARISKQIPVFSKL